MKNLIFYSLALTLTLTLTACSTSHSAYSEQSGASMTPIIQRMNPSTLPDASAMGYSQISIAPAGQYAFISGQVAWQANGSPTPTGLVEQTQVAAKNARAALDAIGASPRNIIMTRIYMVGLTPQRIEDVMPTLIELWEGEQPSLTGVGVEKLAAPDLLIEIEMTVLMPEN